MQTDQDLYNELAFYTLSHPDPAFLHQHIVDAYAAQHATAQSKPIARVFALIGLYLSLEKNFTGRQVQKMHMRLAKQRKQWPTLAPPEAKASITIAQVLAAEPGEPRDRAIRDWCAAVWATWQPHRQTIAALARTELDIRETAPPCADEAVAVAPNRANPQS